MKDEGSGGGMISHPSSLIPLAGSGVVVGHADVHAGRVHGVAVADQDRGRQAAALDDMRKQVKSIIRKLKL